MDEAYKEKYEKNKNESWNQMTAYKKSSELLTRDNYWSEWKWYPGIELCIGIKTNKIYSKETGKMQIVENEQISHESRGMTQEWAPICK